MFPSSLSLTGGAGGAAGPANGTANNGVSTPFNTPFDFDNSGWNIAFASPGASLTSSGNTGANPTTQTSAPTASGSGTPAMSGSMPNGSSLPLILMAIGAYLVLSHKL